MVILGFPFTLGSSLGPPPPVGGLRRDAEAEFPELVTRLWVSHSSSDGTDTAPALAALASFDMVEIAEESGVAHQVRYQVSADVVDHGDYSEIPVVFMSVVGEVGAVPVYLSLHLATPPEPAPPPAGTYPLGPLDTFASPAELRPALGQVGGESNERRMAVALLVATRHVLHVLGYTIDEDLDIPPDPAPLAVNVIPVRSSWRQATIAAAVRFYRSPEVPFGVAGGWDMATYVRMSIPDVDLLLLGQRVAFGIA